MTWAIIGVYLVQFMFGFRVMFREMTKTLDHPDWGEVFSCGLLALLCATMGLGLGIAITVGWKRSMRVINVSPEKAIRVIGGESRSDKIKRLEKAAKNRELKVKRLERELLEQ